MEKERVESSWLQEILSRHPLLDFAGRVSIDSPGAEGIIGTLTLMFIAPKKPISGPDQLFNFQNRLQDDTQDETLYHLPVGCAPRLGEGKFWAGMFSEKGLRVFLFPDKTSAEEAFRVAQTPEGQKDFSFMYLNGEQLVRFNQRNSPQK